MKTNLKNYISVLIAVFTLNMGHRAFAQQKPAPAFAAMVKKLTSLKAISYTSYREINNITDNYFAKQTATCYIEFNQADKRSVSRFRMEDDNYISVYNGTESFGLNKADRTYTLSERVDPRSFANNSYFFNSIPTIRSVAQQLAESDTIPKHQRDTVISNKTYKLVQVDLHRSAMEYLGSTMHFTKDVILYYRIVIDPDTWLPYQVLQTNSVTKDGYNTKVIFTNIDTNPKQPDEYAWYYTTYLKDYQPAKKEKREPLIAPGSLLLDWSLPDFSTGKAFTAADVKGKLVLLDFWIKNCGPCMEAFPVLQRLQRTYGGDKFQLVSINAYDKKEEIAFFYKREKPAYKMLYKGAAWSKGIGVSYYPTAILIDKTGKVIYSGGFDHDKIEALIKVNL